MNEFIVLNCQAVEWVDIFATPVFKNPGIYHKHTSKRTRIFAQEPAGDSQVSGHCGEKKYRGLAVLVGLIAKISL